MLADCRRELTSLISLRQQIGTVRGSALAELRAQVTAAASSASSLAEKTVANAASAGAVDPAARAAAALQTIRDAARDYYDRKLFDPYLKFSSVEDEAAYRERERESKEAYDREMAKGTTEGQRRAAEILHRQLEDAGAHGATESPDYAPTLERVRQAQTALESSRSNEPATSSSAAKSDSATPAPDDDFSDVLAALKEAGVTTDSPPSQGSGHGLTEATRSAAVQSAATGRR